MKNLIIGLSLLTVFLASCQQKISSEKMAQLDVLEMKLDSASTLFFATDSAIAFQAIYDYFERKDSIKTAIRDTISREEARFLDSYLRLRKVVQKYHQNYTPISNELRELDQQLDDLRTDANNNLLEEKYYDEYLEMETENVVRVKIAVEEITTKFNKALPLMEKKSARIDSLIEASKNRHSLEI